VKGLDLTTLVPFALGCATGLLLFVRLLRWLLHRWHGQTVALLVGFMVGSLWKIWPFRTVLETTTNARGKLVVLRDALAAPASTSALLTALLLMGIGVALVVTLELLQSRAGVEEMGG
jgi:putative membrane protein